MEVEEDKKVDVTVEAVDVTVIVTTLEKVARLEGTLVCDKASHFLGTGSSNDYKAMAWEKTWVTPSTAVDTATSTNSVAEDERNWVR